MRAAIVTETFPPDVNGVAFTLDRLASGLHERGNEVEIWRPVPSGTATPERPFPVHCLPSWPVPGYAGLRMGRFSLLRLIAAWRRNRPDVAYIATEGPLGAAALAAAKLCGVPAGTGYHTHFTQYLPSYGLGFLRRPAGALQRWLHNRAAFTMVPGIDTAASLESQGYKRITVLGRGVDTNVFSPEKRSSALRTQWGLPGDATAVLLAGRVAKEKNLPLALDAIRQQRARGWKVQAIVAGDGPFLAECRAQWPWALYTGELSRPELSSVAASCDLLAFPSMTETFGNVLIEAMASGLPCVAFDRAAARQHMEHGVHGWTAAPGDEAAFLRALDEAVLASPARRADMGRAARGVALGLTWESISARFESLLALTAAGRAPVEDSQRSGFPVMGRLAP